MANLSLVANDKIKRDPRKLAFLYPKMLVGRYKELVDEYYRLTTIRAAEEIAKMNQSFLLPSACLNHKRRDPERRMMLFGRTYYCIPEVELTALEMAKYKNLCLEAQGESYENAL